MFSHLFLCLISLCSPGLHLFAELAPRFPALQSSAYSSSRLKPTITRCQKLTISSFPRAHSLKNICGSKHCISVPFCPFAISLSFTVARIHTVYRSQSKLSLQARIPHKLEYLYWKRFFWSIDRHFVRKTECILFDFTVAVHDERYTDLLNLHGDDYMSSLLMDTTMYLIFFS